jgi:glycerol uptake facilitator-like aquaporin
MATAATRSAFVAELVGTFMLTFLRLGHHPGGSQTGAHRGRRLAVASISGAHINPATTIGLVSVRRFPGAGRIWWPSSSALLAGLLNWLMLGNQRFRLTFMTCRRQHTGPAGRRARSVA